MIRLALALFLAGGLAFPEPLPGRDHVIEGRVRLDSGAPVPRAQVRLFDLTDLRASPLAATTDASGHFRVPLGSWSALPDQFELGANYPNPFNPSTIIPYQLPASMHVRLDVFNLLGQRIATLVDGVQPPGFHTAAWDATDAAGRAVGASVYLYRLSGSAGHQVTRRMLLIDGQAGMAAGGPESAAREGETAPVYGLTVSGPGLVPYVDPAFRVTAGMAPVEVVLEAPGRAPRAKVASGGILGDVDNNGRVDFSDALLVALYSLDASTVLPNNGDISLGDVDADGQVDLSDAWTIVAYLNDPSDPSLPSGIGEPVGPAASLSPDPATVPFADDGAWHRFTVHAREPISVVVNPAGTPRGLEITTRSGRGNFCPAEADDDQSRRDGQPVYLAGCAAGEATVELRRESDGTVLRTYTVTVTGGPGTSSVVQLTHNDYGDYRAAWSPDGRRIAFSSWRDGDGDSEIYVMDADGSGVTQLTRNDDEDYFPAWSPDGRRIAFGSDRDWNREIYVMNADGSGATRLTHNIAGDYGPAWSPDGRRIAFDSDRDGDREIYVMNADGSGVTQLTHNGGWDYGAAWSPDGRRIAFSSWRDGETLSIYAMNANGSGVTQLTHNDDLDYSPAWSPDGRRIAFQSDRDGDYEIHVMNADGSGVTQLTHNDDEDWGPAWSPDGRRIAFSSDRDGDHEIYAMNVDGSGPPLPPGFSASLSPDLSTFTFRPDGTWHPFTLNVTPSTARVNVVVNATSASDLALEISSGTTQPFGNYCGGERDDTRRNLRDGATVWLAGCTEGYSLLRVEDAANTNNAWSVGAYVGPADDAFGIELVFANDFRLSDRAIVRDAADRWEQIITAGVPDVSVSFDSDRVDWWDDWRQKEPWLPERLVIDNESVDDLRIYVGYLADSEPFAGWAGPFWIRWNVNAGFTQPALGKASFHRQYADNFRTALHEIGHVLGIGIDGWRLQDLLAGEGEDRHFTGALARAAWWAAGGSRWRGPSVPVEADDGHWKEAAFGNELMTARWTIGRPEPPLSAVTVQALADMGYTVDVSQAEDYSVPATGKPVAADAVVRCGITGSMPYAVAQPMQR